jgi:hypothetical protein
MKHTFFVIAGIIVSAAMGMTVSVYALGSQDKILETLFNSAEVKMSDTDEINDFDKLVAGTDELPFNNLYLFMYKNVLEAPRKAAIKELAKWTTYSQGDLEEILLNGDIQPIIYHQEELMNSASQSTEEEIAAAEADKEAATKECTDLFSEMSLSETSKSILSEYCNKYVTPTVVNESDASTLLSIDAAKDEYLYLLEAYQKEFDLQRENYKLSYEALVSEIFMNNDLSDSADIDLLSDLDLVHEILFRDPIVYPDRSNGDDLSLASEEENEGGTATTDEVVLTEDTVSPYVCQNDSTLADAIGAFEESGGSSTNNTASGNSGADEVTSDSGDNGDDNADGGTGKTVVPKDSKGATDDFGDTLDALAGTKGDWTRSLPCGDVFCITVDIVTQSEESATAADYKKADNCIACHLKYIKEVMDETLSHSLAPSKVPMNYFEDATCKNAGNFVDLDLNVYTVKRPIDLDPGDDIEDAPAKDVENFKNLLWNKGLLPLPGGSDTITNETLADGECNAIISMYEVAGITPTTNEINDRCEDASELIQKEESEAYDKFVFDASFSDQSVLYQQVSAELYAMLLTFENFKEDLEQSFLEDGSPLQNLATKTPYCGQ